jgi:Tol biopolymer transport system component
MRRLIALCSLSATLIATLAIAAPVRAAFPGADGLIAYTDYSLAANGVIATVDPVTKERVGLTTAARSPYGDYEPAWSPGGTLIAFTRRSASSADVWIMNADGSGQKRLTTHSAWDDNPAFSADGSRILFSTDRNGHFDVYSMNLSGGSLQRLTTSTANDFAPVWSPDNDRIAFVSDRRGNLETYLMKVDGSGQTRITDHVGSYRDDVSVDYHPNGDRVVVTTIVAVPELALEGSDLRALSETGGVDNVVSTWSDPFGYTVAFGVFAPAVTPTADGRILFHQSRDQISHNQYDLRILDAEANTPTDLTDFDGLELYPDWQPIPAFPLVDARFSPFKAHIEWAYAEGITGGCTAERFCPEGNVTRAQMAMFLDRALDLPSTTTDFFSDDNGKTGEASINRLAASGITGGCAPGRFCPSASVTRGQMAAFLARALDLPGTSTDYFTDDETSTFESSINKVAAAGITGGCGGTKYCPLGNVTRGQMAAFLRRALD